MAEKLTYEEVKRNFEKAGYVLLSKEYKNCYQKMECICPQGHVILQQYTSFQQKPRCAVCAGQIKATLAEVQDAFTREGYTLLTKHYEKESTPLEYLCPKGHQKTTNYKKFKLGHRCPKCAGKGLTIEDIRAYFELQGYQLLSQEYTNSKQELKYICPKGHHHKSGWTKFKGGVRCAHCSGNAKLSYHEVKKYIESCGYKLLSKEYKNSRQRLLTLCDKGHEYSTKFEYFKHGHRCRTCQHINFRGSLNPRWRHDLTDADRQKDRNLIPGYSEWRRAVYKRDDYTCKICSIKGTSLNAHHIYSYNTHVELRMNVDNGICLCRSCHEEFHSYFKRGSNTLDQIQWFALRKIGTTLNINL